jgi:hypothetical protein
MCVNFLTSGARVCRFMYYFEFVIDINKKKEVSL